MKVIFLDIDGVLQPTGNQSRFKNMHNLPDLCKHLNETLHNGFDYVEFADIHNDRPWNNKSVMIAAVYYDWDKESVERLREILLRTGAKIVVSSDWREGGIEFLKGMLGIHHLDEFVIDTTYFIPFFQNMDDGIHTKDEMRVAYYPVMHELHTRLKKMYPKDFQNFRDPVVDDRVPEIREYLDRHPEITSFVAIDDRNLHKGLNGHFVMTDYKLGECEMEKCMTILNQEDGPYPLEEALRFEALDEWRAEFVFNLNSAIKLR